MSHSNPVQERAERIAPWPDGPDRSLGLFPIVTIGISTSDHNVDAAINSYADRDLSPERRREVVAQLKMLIRHFSGPATLAPDSCED